MEPPDYILDPEGEIIIALKFANPVFVPCEEGRPHKDNSEVVSKELLQRWMAMAIDAGIMEEKYKKLTISPLGDEDEDDKEAASERESGIWGIGGPPVDILPSSLLTEVERAARRSARQAWQKLLLGEEEEEEEEAGTEAVVCFQASAKHLMAASTYFRALLTCGMEESIQFEREGTVRISAEYWDEEALLYVLMIIHCQHHVLPEKVDLEMLAKVCVVADYYDVGDAVRFAARPWIAKLDPQVPEDRYREALLWLWVGVFFRMPGVFKAASLTLIKEGKEDMPPLGLPIPKLIVDEINARRVKAIWELMSHVYGVQNDYLSGERGCSFECSAILYGALTKNLCMYGLRESDFRPPFPHRSYKYLVHVIDRFRLPRWYDPRSSKYLCWQYCEHECHDAHFWELRAGRCFEEEGMELKEFIEMD
ncbi:hypothetical protein AbraIFM66950_002127 [Aspergillus brasiliensis]|nr:hypothetical protein AbraIFM66950_002127 [Aspergillus brasiliensis]